MVQKNFPIYNSLVTKNTIKKLMPNKLINYLYNRDFNEILLELKLLLLFSLLLLELNLLMIEL